VGDLIMGLSGGRLSRARAIYINIKEHFGYGTE